jgi:hypothetical protein
MVLICGTRGLLLGMGLLKFGNDMVLFAFGVTKREEQLPKSRIASRLLSI